MPKKEQRVSTTRPSNGQRLLNAINFLSAVPGGNYIFNRLIAWNIPYSSTIKAKVDILKPGYARMVLKDKRSVRNHLHSIHAVALTNFGELSSGLALNTALPENVRGIVTKITTDYFKKARGTLVAECRCEPPSVTGDVDFTVTADIKDSSEDIVATVNVIWRLGLLSKA